MYPFIHISASQNCMLVDIVYSTLPKLSRLHSDGTIGYAGKIYVAKSLGVNEPTHLKGLKIAHVKLSFEKNLLKIQ